MIEKILKKIAIFFAVIFLLISLFSVNMLFVVNKFFTGEGGLTKLMIEGADRFVDERYEELKRVYNETNMSKNEMKEKVRENIEKDFGGSKKGTEDAASSVKALGAASAISFAIGLGLMMLGTFSLINSLRKIGIVGAVASFLVSIAYVAVSKTAFFAVNKAIENGNVDEQGRVAYELMRGMIEGAVTPVVNYGLTVSTVLFAIFLSGTILIYIVWGSKNEAVRGNKDKR